MRASKLTKRDWIALRMIQGILASSIDFRGARDTKSRVALGFEYADEFLKQSHE